MKIHHLTPTTEILRELGRRLGAMRKQVGLSQEALAEAAGVGVATLRRLEDGHDGKLGSWLRILLALRLEGAVDALLPEDLRSPLAEAKARSKRSRKAPASDDQPGPDGGFVWGDERR